MESHHRVRQDAIGAIGGSGMDRRIEALTVVLRKIALTQVAYFQ